ncbi:transcription factor bHLH123-like isoform X2 [Oryza brachyantha]|uniref:transcription factor bHLH123-like isoform X2 n=1 Tax=Oryza brachyantha TaxID=4533 RepID=UPI0003EAB80E|nr:transcription factor bHLH123-like isoform X2 [Oryza brachyantha]
MADEWWSASSSQRSHGTSACSAPAPPLTDRVSCGWTSPAAAVVAESTSSVTFQDPSRSSATHHQPLSDVASSLGDPHMDWTQAFLSGRSDASFHAVLQDDVAASTRSFRAQTTVIDETVMNNPFRDMGVGQGLLLDKASSLASAPYGTVQLQGLSFDSGEGEPVGAAHNITTTFGDYQHSASYDDAAAMQFSQTPRPSTLPAAAQMQLLSGSYQLPFGSAPPPSQLLLQAMQPKPSCSSNANTLMAKSNSGSAQHACSSAGRKSVSDSAAAAKRPRIEAPSPLPTFKVRKEKLGDRITALQQLVSPFGKTDTASVLHEAIEYIKFLHEQVASLSSPYLKNGNPLQHFQQKGSESSKETGEAKPDLRSRGLCLVPVASTYTVASETVPEFWHPTFGGTFR